MEDSRTLYYARVSTKDQNLARQIETFKAMGAKDDEIISDKTTGANFDREGYNKLKGVLGLRHGDTLVIKELDRLGRDKEGIKSELSYWKEKGVKVKILDIPTTMMDVPTDQEWLLDMVNNILIEAMSTIAEQERLQSLTRQREGIDAMPVINGKKVSIKTGRVTGRPSAEFPEHWDEYYSKWRKGEITAKYFMDSADLRRTTFYKLVKIYEGKAA